MKTGFVSTLCLILATVGRGGQVGADVEAQRGEWQLENQAIVCRIQEVAGELRPAGLVDKLNGTSLSLTGECFRLVLGDGKVLNASEFTLLETPRVEGLQPDRASPVVGRHFAGRQLVARLSSPERNLAAEWRVILREGSSYVRQELTLRALTQDVLVKEIVLFEQSVSGARTVGTVDGSPVVARGWFFGYEHPMAQNTVSPEQLVRCGFLRNAVLKAGEALTQAFVAGVTPSGQLRRGFLDYIERERAHPYRPFLHYNSWYDIACSNRKFDEAECLDVINQFGWELVCKRDMRIDSFLFDDGWDDDRTLWKFHSGFPHGFAPLREAAVKLNASIGVWVSPFGGYDEAKARRLEYGRQQGFETNSSGFSLAGPRYSQRFRQVCLEMIRKYGVNQFKFDGLAARAGAGTNSLTRDGDAMLNLIAELRLVQPDLYINQTVGTWPSPFWLLHVDSTWRGGEDHSFSGKGSRRQQWITYRDQLTYRNIVQGGPLYPLNSLMLHGVIYAIHAQHLDRANDQDFADEVHSFFGAGTQLQELYLTPKLLNQQNWDDLAEAAKWSRENSDICVDTHWVGGDPGKGQVYGWAAWAPRKGILVLRNPDDQPSSFTADVQELFELPAGARKVFHAASPWKNDYAQPAIELRAGQPCSLNLRPFEVLVLNVF